MKILLVEDNQGDARLIREMLGEGEAEQFDLVHVESLAAALKCLGETTVDVVLLDLSLPDSHGLDTFVRIHTQVPAVPIVVLSGFGDETFAVEAVRQGAQDYLTKGKFDGNQLARSMRYAIERQRIENALKQSEEKSRITFESITDADETFAVEAVRQGAQDYLTKGKFDGNQLARSMRYAIERQRIENALKQSEGKLHTTFESITDAIVITDTLGTIVQTNEAATRMTGYSREEIIGKSGLDLIDPKYHDMAVQTMMKVLEEGHGMESMELQFLTKDGGYVDAEFGTAMIRDTSGNPAGFVSIARDITERKRARDALRESEVLYRSLVEHLPQRIFIKDHNGVYLSCNDNYARDLRIAAQRIVGKDDFAFYPPELANKYRADDQEVMAGGQLKDIEEKYLAAGEERWVHTVKVPYHDDQGHVVGVLGIFEDITERKRAETALLVKDWAVEAAINAIAISDLAGNLNYVNTAFIKLWGYSSPAEVLGKSATGFWQMGEKAAEVMEALRTSRGWFGELVAQRKDGTFFDVEVAASLVVNPAGQPICMQASFADITERKRAEEKLRFFALAVESSSDAIGMSTPDGKHYYQNKAFDDLFGDIGDNPPATVFVDEQVGREVFRTIMGGNPWTGEIKMRGKAGELLDVFERAYAIKDDTERILGLVGIHTDITERKQAEEALRASEEKLRVTFESINDTIVITDTLGTIVQTNEEATRLSGYSREELIGKSGLDLIDPKCHAMAVQTMIKVFEEGHGMESMELQFLTKDGRYVDAEFGTAMIRDTSGNPAGFVSIARDITERKQMEHQVRERVKELQAFYGLAEITEREGITLDKLYQELANILPKSWQYPEIACARIVIGDSEFRTENFAESPWKQSAPVKVDGSAVGKIDVGYLEERPEEDEGPFLKEERQLIDTIAERIGRITERKQMEEALKESEERSRLLLHAAGDGIFGVDNMGQVNFVNPVALRTLGFAVDEMLGQKMHALIHHSHKDGSNYPVEDCPMYASYTKAAETFVTDEVLWRKDGSCFPVDYSSMPITKDGRVIGAVVTFRDITQRKRMEEEVRESEGKLRAMFKSTSDGIVVTDLRFNILEANEAAARIFGHKSKESLIGTSALGMVSNEKVVDADGKQIFIEFSVSQIHDAAGNLTGNIGIARDVTERKRAAEAIRQRNRELAAMNTISQSLSQQVKLDDVLKTALDATLEVMGLPAGGIWLIDEEEQKLVLTVHKGVCEGFTTAAKEVPLGAGITGEVTKIGRVTVSMDICDDIRVPHTLKSIASLDDLRALISVPLKSKDKTLGVMNIFDRKPGAFPERDIRLLETIGGQIGAAIESAQLLEKLEEISITDKLTGLYNRRHFYEVLESEVNRTQRYGHPFSLVMLDLDGFKAYNDKFGHMTGDEILKDFAATLKATLRKSDRAFRYGGDEFAIVLPSTDAAKADKLVDRFRTKWPQTVDGEFEILETPLGFSAGIAQFPEDIDTLDGLITMADAALYKAKREGKYRTDLASELGQLSAEVMASNH